MERYIGVLGADADRNLASLPRGCLAEQSHKDDLLFKGLKDGTYRCLPLCTECGEIGNPGDHNPSRWVDGKDLENGSNHRRCPRPFGRSQVVKKAVERVGRFSDCLLYTSDAADE